MKNIHAKPARRTGRSPCCQEKIIKFGTRRKQCIECRSTWRVRKKKRGRKKRRVSTMLYSKYLSGEMPTLYALAKAREGKNEDRRQRDLKRSTTTFVTNTPWPLLPYGEPTIAVADAMIITLNKCTYTFYFIIVRRILDTEAFIAEPYVKEGAESCLGWQEAFAQLPKATIYSICALVCDGHIGFRSIAKQHRWPIQQCNFHAIARIQGRRSRWAQSRHRKTGEILYRLMREILTNPSEEEALDSVRQLWEISRQTSSPQLKIYLSGFTRRYWEYRTYLEYPELHLPRTSNSVEALIGSIRKLCNRAHGFRTINSLTLWIHALLKKKKRATCNGYLPTKLLR